MLEYRADKQRNKQHDYDDGGGNEKDVFDKDDDVDVHDNN